jgi:dipeptidyl aminopeptidase/acylaminoacyl peptidase
MGILLLVLSGAASAAPPIEPYGRLPGIEQGSLSPDGTKLAFIRTLEDTRLLSVVGIDQHNVIAVARIGDQKIRDIDWADDTHLLITTASTTMPWGLIGEKTEWRRIFIYDLNTHKIQALLDRIRGDARTMNVIVREPIRCRTDKGPALMLHGLYVADETRLALYFVNLKTGDERLMREGDATTRGWMVDDRCEIVAEDSYTDRTREWRIRVYRDGHPAETVRGTADIEGANSIGLSPDGESIIVSVFEDGGYVWRKLSRRDATWGAEVYPKHRLTDALRASASDRMIGAANIGDETHYYFDSADTQSNWDWVTRVLHDERLELVSTSNDTSRLLVRAFGPNSGYGYFLADLGEHAVVPVGPVYEGITAIGEVKVVHYKAADGLEIPGYLTLPPGRGGQHLPLVVFPHGGPEARDSRDFDFIAQAFASQGYAVLQPNYRGSELNREWVEKGFGEFGRKMQTDLSDGVHYLVEKGIADPARVCIVGASYGGYAALAGVTLQNGIYRCAAAIAGLSDLKEFVRHVQRKEGGQRQGARYWERFMGANDPADPRLREISPILHVDNVTVPVMLVHGKEDTVVPFDQSSDMAKALKRAQKPYEFVTLDQEDHFLSRSATRLQTLRAVVGFVLKNNPPD